MVQELMGFWDAVTSAGPYAFTICTSLQSDNHSNTGMVICLERDADLHMAQLMPLPLTVSCFSKIQTGFTFLVPAHPGSPGKRAVKRVCVCVCFYDFYFLLIFLVPSVL